MERLFVYGTLAPGRANERLLAAVEGRWERGTVRGHLHPEGWGATLGYPAIRLDDAGPQVEGFLFSSEHLGPRWSLLDQFEGEEYERVRTTVECEDGSRVTAFIYQLREA